MTDYSVANAKNAFPRLVRQAESGKTVRITRRGKPVAVLLSEREYDRLRQPRGDIGQFLAKWHAAVVARGAEFPSGDEFDGVRDRSPGRDAPWT